MNNRTNRLIFGLLAAAAIGHVSAAAPIQRDSSPTSPTVRVDDLNDFMQNYYKAPHPAEISQSMIALDQSGYAAKRSAQPSIILFYSAIYAAADKAQQNAWRAEIKRLNGWTKALLEFAISTPPETILDGSTISPARNDMAWGGFLATGDLYYVDEVIARLDDLGERKDLTRFLTAGSAAWSLASNAQQHPKVRAHLAARQASNGPQAAIVAELLHKPSDQFQEEITQTLKAQHQAGVW